jgi:hypothetical protein
VWVITLVPTVSATSTSPKAPGEPSSAHVDATLAPDELVQRLAIRLVRRRVTHEPSLIAALALAPSPSPRQSHDHRRSRPFVPTPPTFSSHTDKAIRPSRTLIAISTDRMPASIEAGREADFEPLVQCLASAATCSGAASFIRIRPRTNSSPGSVVVRSAPGYLPTPHTQMPLMPGFMS